MKKNLINEYDFLESVIVHPPGLEHMSMTPKHLNSKNRGHYLLFDDVLYMQRALLEHANFVATMESMGLKNCFYLKDLLKEVLSEEEVKNSFISDISEFYDPASFPSDLDTDSIIAYLLMGDLKSINPLPNIMFTRDLAISLGNSMIITWASNKVRNPENIIAKYIIKNHKLFSDCNIYDFHENHPDLALEGGDVTLINKEVIAIGISERTSEASVRSIAPFLYKNGIKYILCFKMPEERRFMHLDTVFSIINTNEAIVYFPFFESGNPKELDVDIIKISKNGSLSTSSLKSSNVFNELNIDFTFIKCGGNASINQQREQWTDGANAFCLSPGKIIIYDRNVFTVKELEKHGYKIMTGLFLNPDKDKNEDLARYMAPKQKKIQNALNKQEKVAITIESGELSRGRGGPRCMTMPINRVK